jgi:FkbM family methyltransferase
MPAELPMTPPSLQLFSAVGSPQGFELTTWCPMASRTTLRKHLLAERTRLNELPPRLIIDVGSFDGRDAIAYAQASTQRVWTFEPTPAKHDGIRRRLREAGVAEHVTLFPYALSNRTGEGHLEVMRAPHRKGRMFMANGSLGSAQDLLVQQERPGQLPRLQAGVVAVPIRQLDHVVEAHVGKAARIAYMKVDAQGADMLVLSGARRLLTSRQIERFAFEFTPFLMPGRLEAAVEGLTWLEQLRYMCVPCNQAHTVPFKLTQPATIREYVERYRGHEKYDDIICQPRAHVD